MFPFAFAVPATNRRGYTYRGRDKFKERGKTVASIGAETRRAKRIEAADKVAIADCATGSSRSMINASLLTLSSVHPLYLLRRFQHEQRR